MFRFGCAYRMKRCPFSLVSRRAGIMKSLRQPKINWSHGKIQRYLVALATMKLLALLFAFVVLLESTLQAGCLKLPVDKPDTCCADTCGAENPPPSPADDGCDSGCNPFQHCGCCKGAQTLGHLVPASVTMPCQPSSKTYTAYAERLPETILLFPKQPPQAR